MTIPQPTPQYGQTLLTDCEVIGQTAFCARYPSGMATCITAGTATVPAAATILPDHFAHPVVLHKDAAFVGCHLNVVTNTAA